MRIQPSQGQKCKKRKKFLEAGEGARRRKKNAGEFLTDSTLFSLSYQTTKLKVLMKEISRRIEAAVHPDAPVLDINAQMVS